MLLEQSNEVGTDRYMYPFVPKPEKVQIGTTPFRGVPFVPRPKTVARGH